MNTKYIVVPALALLASCSWTQRQSDNFMQWSDRNMPTFDGSHPGANPTPSANGGVIPDHYNGYPYNSSLPRTSMTTPGVSGYAAPPLPGYGGVAPAGVTSYSSNGMTPAQTTSAAEGGNSRPNPNAPVNSPAPASRAPSGPTYQVTPIDSMHAPAPSANIATPPSDGRRVPAGMLPPSAIQPVPYGQQSGSDFPAEYKNAGQPNATPDGLTPPPF